MFSVLVLQEYSGPPHKVAVRGLSFGVPRGQRFGLLGANGAGKSTTQQVRAQDEEAHEPGSSCLQH